MIFLPLCFYFFPSRPCNNCSTFTECIGRKIWQEGNQNRTMFHKIMGNLEKKMQVIGDIISYLSPYYFICNAKKSTKIQREENIWYFFPLCLYFFPLRPCNNCSTVTDGVLGRKYGNREIKSYFSRGTLSFFVTVFAYFNRGKIYDIFSPCVFFSPVSFFPCVFIFPS